MVDGMEVSGAARPPPHFMLPVPTDSYFQSTAILGTTTARTELLGRRARRAFHPPLPTWYRGLHLLWLILSGGASGGSPDARMDHLTTYARPSPPRRPSPPPHYTVPCSPLWLLRSSRSCSLALPTYPDDPFQLLSTQPSWGSYFLSPAAPRMPALSARVTLHPTASSLLSAPFAPPLTRSPIHSRRKAIPPEDPDAREGQGLIGQSSIRTYPMLAYRLTKVHHESSNRNQLASQLYIIPTTRAPFSAGSAGGQLWNRSRPSESRAAEHHHLGRYALHGQLRRQPQRIGAYYRAWCVPMNQSPNPITTLISHHPILAPIAQSVALAPQPRPRQRHTTARLRR